MISTEEKLDSEAVSKALGEKLLLGWTMLQDCCPRCIEVPLMRSKDKQLLCVKCNRSPNQSNPEPTMNDEEIERLLEPVSNNTVVYDSVQSTQFTSENLTGIKNTLLQKLNLLEQKLNGTDRVEEIASICSAIKECTNALQALHYF